MVKRTSISISFFFFSCAGKRELIFHCANLPAQRRMIKMLRGSGLGAQRNVKKKKKNLKAKVN